MNKIALITGATGGVGRAAVNRRHEALLIGTLLLAAPSLLARLIASPDDALVVITTDIYVISLIILH